MKKSEKHKKIEVDNGKQIFEVYMERILWKGKEAYLEFAKDVTIERKKDDMLEDSLKRFNIALENSDLMIWEYDMVNNLCINFEKAGKDYNIPLIIENHPGSLYETDHVPSETSEQIKEVKKRLLNGESGFSVERKTANLAMKK